MNFKLHNEPCIQVPDVEFTTKQPVKVENTPLCKSADPITKEKLITGTYYIAHPRITRGFVRVCASPADCDARRVAGYVTIANLIKLNKELRHNNG